jgi:hypothetical protein
MPTEPTVVHPGRLARWLLLAALLTAGIVSYFRTGVALPTFGSATAATADSTR